MIRIEDAAYSYGDRNPVLQGVNMVVNDGEFLGLVGRNGAGKTTLLRIIMGLLKPTVGKVENIFQRSAFISQVTGSNDMVFPATVEEVVSLGLKYKPFAFMRKSDWAKVDRALEIMGVLDLKKKAIGDLSGGQQQRVRLAKALISDPDLLVMDEPTTGMDEESREEFLKETLRLNREYGKTVVLVTHFPEDLKGADRILKLTEGIIVEVDSESEGSESEDKLANNAYKGELTTSSEHTSSADSKED